MTKLPLFDHYSLRARLQPALLTLLPLAFAIFAWTGQHKPWMSALWTLCGTAGATYFLAALARNRGKEIEPALWQSWGGPPTTQMLRHRGPANPVLRARWHAQLVNTLQRPLPTAAEEASDPTAADAVYEAATKLLISKTRDTKKFALLYKENVAYGFCRNLYAMRPIGGAVAIAGVAFATAAAIAKSGPFEPTAWACVALNAIFALAWIFRVTAKWVRVPAFAYAERLFESLEAPSRAKAAKTEPLTAK